MGWILCTVVEHGFDCLSVEFLTAPSKPYGEPGAGIANALLGTLMIAGGATLSGPANAGKAAAADSVQRRVLCMLVWRLN